MSRLAYGRARVLGLKTAWARRWRMVALVAAVVGIAMIGPQSASAATLSATPSSLGSVFGAAQGGDTILLASGNYGTFTGGLKPGVVTLQAQPGASPTMAVSFDPASNITLDGLTLTEIDIANLQTKNITVRNSSIPGQTIFRSGSLANANILFDHNVHGPFDKCSGCYEGRVQLAERTGEPSGITIANSLFGPGGNSDGIQNGSNGTRILNNEFLKIHQIDGDAVHADSIQLYGSQNTVIRGNWFHDVSVGIMCADQCDHEDIEDNVFNGDESPYQLNLLSDNGSLIRHNTFVDGACSFNLRCGIIYLGNKSGDPASTGTVVTDNIISSICVCSGTASGLDEESYNLFTGESSGGSHDLTGAPTYVGGANPSSYAGFALAAGSKGKGDASDGLDRGIRPNGGPPPGLAGTIGAGAGSSIRVLSTLRSIKRTGRLRLRIKTASKGKVRVSGFIRPGKALPGKRAGHSRKLIRLNKKSLGTKPAGKRTVSLKLSARTRRMLARSRDARLAAVLKVDSVVTQRKLKIKKR